LSLLPNVILENLSEKKRKRLKYVMKEATYRNYLADQNQQGEAADG